MIEPLMELDLGDLLLSIISFFAGVGARDFYRWLRERKADE